MALQYASDELKSDQNVVLAAYKENPVALWHVSYIYIVNNFDWFKDIDGFGWIYFIFKNDEIDDLLPDFFR